MTKIICLFRFHKYPKTVRARVKFLRKLNPGLLVIPLYGGLRQNLGRFKSIFKSREWQLRWVGPSSIQPPYSACDIKLLEEDYGKIKENTNLPRLMATFLKWRDGDLAILDWFEQKGYKLEFSHVVNHEWDMLYYKPWRFYYGKLKANQVGFPQEPHKPSPWHFKNWDWMRGCYRARYQALKGYLNERYGYKKDLMISTMHGVALSKKFLIKYAQEDIEMLRFFSNDELRLPSFVTAYGFKAVNLKLKKEFCRVRSSKEKKLSIHDIKLGLKQRIGVFHPYLKERFPI